VVAPLDEHPGPVRRLVPWPVGLVRNSLPTYLSKGTWDRAVVMMSMMMMMVVVVMVVSDDDDDDDTTSRH
jgi:hypothetical protein